MRTAFVFTAFIAIVLALTFAVVSPARQSAAAPAAPVIAPNAPRSPTFYRDVLPVLQQHCQGCHRVGEIGPMPLVTYEQARPYARAIAAAATLRKMPPWFADPSVGHFSNDPSLTPQEIATLAAWAKSGGPAGDPRNAPAPLRWVRGWMIPQPDAVFSMPKPVAIPADGDVAYTYEIVHTGFTEGKWVSTSEIRPSSRENVHHAVVYIRPPGSTWLQHAPINVPFTTADMTDEQDREDTLSTTSDVLLVYAPGSSPDNWPEGMAKFIPAGSDLVFQMHYTTHGRRAIDRTSIGLIFAKHAPKQRVLNLQLMNSSFVIPPGVPDFRVEVHGSLPQDAELLSFFPHMHLRGKRFEYNILHPDGSIEPLLRVNYDFYWQMSYRLAQPLPLKAGTVLQAVAYYDNSKNNPHNPDPDSAVSWGEQTYDEMMVGFFDVAVPADVDTKHYFIREICGPSGKAQ
jgi:mono/diheme cytochrome c family protein